MIKLNNIKYEKIYISIAIKVVIMKPYTYSHKKILFLVGKKKKRKKKC